MVRPKTKLKQIEIEIENEILIDDQNVDILF